MKITTKNMILTSLFAALTAIGAVLIVIPLGPVDFTLQLFFTILSGIILGSKYGAMSQILYVGMGIIGLPVFAGGKGGFAYIFAPSFGYLLGFILGAYISGKIVEKLGWKSFKNILIASLAGLAAVYLIGFPYLYIILTKVNGLDLSFYEVLKSGVLIFMPGDLIKCVIASLLSIKVLPILKKEILR